MAKTYFYRVEETTYSAGVDEWGDALPGGPTRPNLYLFEVLKYTRCGAWLDVYGERKFVNLQRNKRFALPTTEEAIASYKARKKRQIEIYAARINKIKEALLYLDMHGFYTDQRRFK